MTTNTISMATFFFKPQFLWGMPGGTEWILIILVVLLFFGGRKIPELMRGIGKGVKEFNSAKEDIKSSKEINDKGDDARVNENRDTVKTEISK